MRYVLCDDHRLFVESFGGALGRRGHLVTVVTRPEAALPAVLRSTADMCVVDLRFPEGSGLDVVAAVRRRRPDCPVVVLTGSTRMRDAAAASAAGSAAFLRKDQPMSEIFSALDRVAAGRRLAPARVPPTRDGSGEELRVRRLVELLTGREREVLLRLVAAEDTEGIARSLGVAPSTARTHLQNVLLKLGVHSRIQAVALVAGAGLEAELGHR